MVVLARDGWRCKLCGKRTPKRLRGTTHPDAPEIDHIIPLALGGAHSYANTQCSCRDCNGKKGARVLPGLLRPDGTENVHGALHRGFHEA